MYAKCPKSKIGNERKRRADTGVFHEISFLKVYKCSVKEKQV